MGIAKVSCVDGCTCEEQTIDALVCSHKQCPRQAQLDLQQEMHGVEQHHPEMTHSLCMAGTWTMASPSMQLGCEPMHAGLCVAVCRTPLIASKPASQSFMSSP
jgi:hypothetical protein